MHTPSVRPSKTDPSGVSCIVPFATHVDHTEHDLDVIVTDARGVHDAISAVSEEITRAPEAIEHT
jgi:acetyl-CoA hydrolase